MKHRSVFGFMVVMILLGVWGLGGAAYADSSQSTFSISPPPIATPVFGVKESDIKVGATYVNIKSTDTTTTNFKLDGYGVDFVGRSAFGKVLAIDYAVGAIYLTGDLTMSTGGTGGGSTSISGASIPISFNLEVQPYKNDVFNIILFAGPAFNITALDIKSTIQIGSTTYNDTITTTSYLYGPQGGVQMGFELGPLHIDAFGMAISQQGSQTMSSSYGGDTTSSIPAYTTTSYGADFMYVPWGLTLSSILQEAKQGDNNGFKTTMYQFSWSHKF
jgi:hypothetical protein